MKAHREHPFYGALACQGLNANPSPLSCPHTKETKNSAHRLLGLLLIIKRLYLLLWSSSLRLVLFEGDQIYRRRPIFVCACFWSSSKSPRGERA